MKIPKLKIKDIELKVPVIQGGMGIGVSLSRLAAAVANEGGLGVISGAQVGYREDDFESNPHEANVRALKNEIKKAKENSPKGFIGVNLMVATKNYADMVKAAVEAKVDVIISGAGLPLDLPKFIEKSKVKIIPIVSSLRAAKIIMSRWEKRYNRQPDAIVVEGSEAGGHLGFSMEELKEKKSRSLKEIVRDIIEFLKEKKLDIPVIAAGGIYSGKDVVEQLQNGAAGVQMGTRFVTTYECDASDEFKQNYLNAKEEDISIVKSPVGLPGRAIRNKFIKDLEVSEREEITKCYKCIIKCNPKETPYCITKALINAVSDKADKGLVFVGSNAYRNDRMESVKEVFDNILMELKTI